MTADAQTGAAVGRVPGADRASSEPRGPKAGAEAA